MISMQSLTEPFWSLV